MQDILDDFVVEKIMTIGLKSPKEIMNMGLACRRWYRVAKSVLMGTPEAVKATTFARSSVLGWPCLVLHSIQNVKEYPDLDLLAACLGHNRREVKRWTGRDSMALFAFVMSQHPRLGAESPAGMISHWVLRSIKGFMFA